jgi:hypothetical protein
MPAHRTLSSILNDPGIIVDEKEDLNLNNNICRLLVKAMNVCEGNKLMAAKKLGITTRSLYNYFGYNPILFDTITKKYVTINDVLHNSDEKNRFIGILPPNKKQQKK